MENKNSGMVKILIVIIILLLILSLVGVILINKGIITINSNNNKEEEKVEEKKEEVDNKLSNEEALKLVEEKYKYAEDTIIFRNTFKYSNIKNEQLDAWEVLNYSEVSNNFVNLAQYYNTNILIVEADGKAYSPSPEGGRGLNIYYHDTKLEIVSATENEIVANAIVSYCTESEDWDPTDPSAPPIAPADCNKLEEKTNEFSLVYLDGIWKINKFTVAY